MWTEIRFYTLDRWVGTGVRGPTEVVKEEQVGGDLLGWLGRPVVNVNEVDEVDFLLDPKYGFQILDDTLRTF